MIRSAACVLSGVLAVLALGLGALPAEAQSANGFIPIAGCSVIAYDANTSAVQVLGLGGVQAGSVTVTVPCDGPVFVSLTAVVQADGTTSSNYSIAASCVAPAVPGGCTVGGAAVNPIPNNGTIVGGTGVIPRQSRTVAAVFPNLQRGNYSFEIGLSNNFSGVTFAASERLWTVQTAAVLPVTPPGSSQ